MPDDYSFELALKLNLPKLNSITRTIKIKISFKTIKFGLKIAIAVKRTLISKA